jgi:hypothetical protein
MYKEMTFEEGIKQVNKGYEKIVEANSLMTDAIMNAFIFTWQWWLGVGLFIITWVLWFMFNKKESSHRLLYAGFVTIIVALIIDIIALSLGKWAYPVKLVPFAPVLFLPYHFSLVPVSIMFMIQIKPSANPFVKAVIFAGVGAFIGMRIFVLIDFYDPKGWPSTYDFFILLFIYLVAHWFSMRNSFDKIQLNDKVK